MSHCGVSVAGSQASWWRRKGVCLHPLITQGPLRCQQRLLALCNWEECSEADPWAARFSWRCVCVCPHVCMHVCVSLCHLQADCEVGSLLVVPKPSFLKSFLCPQPRARFYFFSYSVVVLCSPYEALFLGEIFSISMSVSCEFKSASP